MESVAKAGKICILDIDVQGNLPLSIPLSSGPRCRLAHLHTVRARGYSRAHTRGGGLGTAQVHVYTHTSSSGGSCINGGTGRFLSPHGEARVRACVRVRAGGRAGGRVRGRVRVLACVRKRAHAWGRPPLRRRERSSAATPC